MQGMSDQQMILKEIELLQWLNKKGLITERLLHRMEKAKTHNDTHKVE
jgi:hypothetical protein